jgi:caa(3)-type oxidase subunit IV
VSGFSRTVEKTMHSDPEAIKKTIRSYLMVGAALLVFTGITVAANSLHLAVPAAVTVALIIAAMKGSMVASIFMHLTHEKKWIYGSLLLTIIGFIILMTVPIFTVMDNIGTPGPAVGVAAHPAHPEH